MASVYIHLSFDGQPTLRFPDYVQVSKLESGYVLRLRDEDDTLNSLLFKNLEDLEKFTNLVRLCVAKMSLENRGNDFHGPKE